MTLAQHFASKLGTPVTDVGGVLYVHGIIYDPTANTDTGRDQAWVVRSWARMNGINPDQSLAQIAAATGYQP